MVVPWPEVEEKHDQHDRRLVDGLVSTGRHLYQLGIKGKNKGEKGRDEGEGYCESDEIWMVLPNETKTKLFIG